MKVDYVRVSLSLNTTAKKLGSFQILSGSCTAVEFLIIDFSTHDHKAADVASDTSQVQGRRKKNDASEGFYSISVSKSGKGYP